MGDERYPQIEAYLCNNPRRRTTFTNPIKGKEIQVKAFPALVVGFRDLPRAGLWKIGATVFSKDHSELVSLEATAASENGRIRWSYNLGEPLPNPWTVHVWARQDCYLFEETTGL